MFANNRMLESGVQTHALTPPDARAAAALPPNAPFCCDRARARRAESIVFLLKADGGGFCGQMRRVMSMVRPRMSGTMTSTLRSRVSGCDLYSCFTHFCARCRACWNARQRASVRSKQLADAGLRMACGERAVGVLDRTLGA